MPDQPFVFPPSGRRLRPPPPFSLPVCCAVLCSLGSKRNCTVLFKLGGFRLQLVERFHVGAGAQDGKTNGRKAGRRGLLPQNITKKWKLPSPTSSGHLPLLPSPLSPATFINEALIVLV
ncbi:hypothetical protein KSP39_PZI000447 [Platanthera zijinensis]|uniref:Uncharacterized protein n=1 Tax=Platanthera zijinensis TaxID=2320716 RepID=A0AAP0C1U1_9ASPA